MIRCMSTVNTPIPEMMKVSWLNNADMVTKSQYIAILTNACFSESNDANIYVNDCFAYTNMQINASFERVKTERPPHE